jgi:hypothetical protein
LPVFASAQDVYDHIGAVLAEMVVDPMAGPHFQRADRIVQYRYSDPDAVITVDLRRDFEPSCVFGATDVEPEVVMSMDADTAHRFFLGTVNVTIALARGQIRAEGPVNKILRLVPLVKPFFPRYRALVEAEGRSDLVLA